MIAGALLVGCSQAPQWHPVTAEESEQLAIARFNNFDIGTRPFHTEITVGGAELQITGWYDFFEHFGYASVTSPQSEPQVLVWGRGVVAIRPQPDSVDSSNLPTITSDDGPPTDGWALRGLNPEASLLDTTLAAFPLVASDRPDNPLLFQQSGALWLEQATHEPSGSTADVFAAPPSDSVLGPDDPTPTPETATVHMWVDSSGVLLRVSLRIYEDWIDIDFGPREEEAPDLFDGPGSPGVVFETLLQEVSDE